ncbi:SRPBCC family protein [Microbaculum marinum]|uniref:SRPBCC family protein n=1 Tax=Microbaculum marinum TaxID=1764581 RepID=A0AAW9RT73_9HYPH
MRWIVRFVVALVIMAALLAAVGLIFLPRYVSVSRSVVISAPASAVWPYVSDLRRFNEWSPWAGIDPQGTTYAYEGADSGVGQTMHWSSAHEQVGSGTQEVIAIDPGRSVETRLDFGEMGTAQAGLTLTPNEGATEVTWDFRTDLGVNPVARWFGLMFDRWVGNDYEKGLARLKERVESGPSASQ